MNRDNQNCSIVCPNIFYEKRSVEYITYVFWFFSSLVDGFVTNVAQLPP